MNKDIPRIGAGAEIGYNANAYSLALNVKRMHLEDNKGRLTFTDTSGNFEVKCPEAMFPFAQQGELVILTIAVVRAGITQPERPPQSILIKPGND